MALCLHILRLRPTYEQLAEWNDDVTEISKTFEMHGWTAFLKELTPASLFDGLDSEKPGKRTRRSKLLNDLYEIAEQEERHLNGECGQYL